MHTIRCQCGKIVCQVAHLPAAPNVRTLSAEEPGATAYILCRHCKRHVVIQVAAIIGVSYANTAP